MELNIILLPKQINQLRTQNNNQKCQELQTDKWNDPSIDTPSTHLISSRTFEIEQGKAKGWSEK